MSEKAEPDELRDVAEVDIDIVHGPGIDALARDRVGLIGKTQVDAVDPRQRAVEFGRGRGPVHTPIRNGSPRACACSIRRASASGTAFGYPDPVKPLMPTFEPWGTRAAASSADMIFERSADDTIRE